MYRLHLARNLRSLGFLLAAAVLAAIPGLLWWANHTGLPPAWRAAIEHEISRHGAYVRIGGLSYMPLRGLSARDVRVFADPDCQQEISRLERVLLGFDKMKLARGQFQITKIELNNAHLQLPVDPQHPHSEILEVTNAHGTLLTPGNKRLEIRDAIGRIQGIDVELNARLIGYQQQPGPTPPASQTSNRRKLIARVIEELNRWHFSPSEPPQLRVQLDGNANENSSILAKFSLTSRSLEKDGYQLDDVRCEAELSGNLLTVTSLKAQDGRGSLDARLDYDINQRSGRFDVRSSIDIPPLLNSWFGIRSANGLLVGGSQKIDALGEFSLRDGQTPYLHLTGQADCGSVMVRGIPFDRVECAFSWREGDLFLRGLRLTRPDGTASGKAMIQWPLVRLALESDLPAHVYLPLFTGKPLERVIRSFESQPGSALKLSLEGGFDATDRHSWAYTGSGSLERMSYKGVPLRAASCRFSLSHQELDFSDGSVTFDYRRYPLRTAHNGPTEGTAQVGRIRYLSAQKTVEVENVSGPVWAAPLVRMFAPKVADSLERYRFRKPPHLHGSGLVDVTPQGRTRLDVDFQSDAAADYQFLGKEITLRQPSGRVTIRGPRVRVRNLAATAFNGTLAADFNVPGNGQIEGEIAWTRLSVPELGATYDFQIRGGGDLTGRIRFSLASGRIETMNGEGLFALERTELFAVPIFGPLSALVSGVLNDRRAGFERAKDAFCNFQIENGVLRTTDFHTSTPSLTFTGDGAVDLKDRTFDMTMRLNARGLLGLITLPLRPFYGMFQFRGTGPLKQPQWENVMFTDPPAEQGAKLIPPPKARVVRPSSR